MVQTSGASVAPHSSRSVEVYDFRRPTTLTREHSRALELSLETFTRQWGTQLTAKVRVRSQVTFDQLDVRTYDEYASSLPAATTMVLLSAGEAAEKLVLQFPTPAALTWFSYMLGGSSMPDVSERTFTAIEHALAVKLVEACLDDLHYSFGTLLPEQVVLDTIHHNSQFAQAAAPTDLVIVAQLTVTVGERSDEATLVLPADMVFRQLGDAHPVAGVEGARELVEQQLASVPLTLALRFAGRSVTPENILDLAVGDLLPLPHHSKTPLDLTVDDIVVARAAVGSSGSRVACVVVDN